MKKLLHIIASPKGEESRTLKVSAEFLKEFKIKNPDCEIEELNVFNCELPVVTPDVIKVKFSLFAGQEVSEEDKKHWNQIESYINQFISADAYLLSTPMWNFNIPYRLKHYLDVIVQPKYLFEYTSKGPNGLIKDKKLIVITSRGGDYSPHTPFYEFDYQEPYLLRIFSFIGFSDITFINAQPMDSGDSSIQKQKIEEAIQEAKELVATF